MRAPPRFLDARAGEEVGNNPIDDIVDPRGERVDGQSARRAGRRWYSTPRRRSSRSPGERRVGRAARRCRRTASRMTVRAVAPDVRLGVTEDPGGAQARAAPPDKARDDRRAGPAAGVEERVATGPTYEDFEASAGKRLEVDAAATTKTHSTTDLPTNRSEGARRRRYELYRVERSRAGPSTLAARACQTVKGCDAVGGTRPRQACCRGDAAMAPISALGSRSAGRASAEP